MFRRISAGIFVLVLLGAGTVPALAQPVDVVWVVDRSSSMATSIAVLQTLVPGYLQQFEGRVCTPESDVRHALVTFTETFEILSLLTTDEGAIASAFDGIVTVNSSTNGAVAISIAATLPFTPGSRRIFLLVTDEDAAPPTWDPGEEAAAISALNAIQGELWVCALDVPLPDGYPLLTERYRPIQEATGSVAENGEPLVVAALPSGLVPGGVDAFPWALGLIADSIDCGAEFSRGDANQDGAVDIGDPIAALAYLFSGQPNSCLDALDSNDDGAVNIADPIHLLAYQFTGGTAPPEPFPGCGPDSTPLSSAGCVEHVVCTTVEPAVYLSIAGNDALPGTSPAQPVRTLSRAIQVAQYEWIPRILVSEGSYAVTAPLWIPTGLSVLGGHDPIGWSYTGGETLIDLDGSAWEGLRVVYATLPTVLSDLAISNHHAISGLASGIGILARESDGLAIVRCQVEVEAGLPGANGASPGGTAAAGAPGTLGQPGCENSTGFCSTCPWPLGGSGGPGGGNGFAGGAGGRPTDPTTWGLSGFWGQGPHGGVAGIGAPPGQGNWVVPVEFRGGHGGSGADGADAPARVWEFVYSGIQSSLLVDGAAGEGGSGGGGGGGGGGGSADCDSYGGAGGGGGGGGGGGLGGGSGSCGGCSIGIYLWASDATILDCSIVTGAGGAGGAGGDGQLGGSGGAGAAIASTQAGAPYGGSGEQDDGSNGGRGGNGGSGGRGGHGGGAGGGHSIGVVTAGGSVAALGGTTISVGLGGTGGSSLANPGAPGIQAEVWAP